MAEITFIGDCHNKYTKYLDICQFHQYTIQIGDLSYNYDFLKNLDSTKHKFCSGNHDHHDICYDLPHCLGRFGPSSLNGIDFFFVSGGFSIDWKYRLKLERAGHDKSWFPNEELNMQEQLDCIDLYSKVKPRILVTHEPPRQICKDMGNPEVLKSWGYDPDNFNTATSQLLDDMIKIHRPNIVISGHMHKEFIKKQGGTTFIVLDKLQTLTIKL